MACEQTCSCGDKIDKILWQTLGAFDLVHSAHKWVPAILLCGKHGTTVQAWIFSRLWFCRRLGRLKINLRRCLVYFRESHDCANKLDVQETNFSFTQVYRSWNHFSRCRFTHGRYSRSHSGYWWLKYFILYRTEQMNPRESYGQTRRQLSSQTCITPSQSSTPTSFQQTLIPFHQIQRILVPVLCCMSFEVNEAVVKMINQRSKSHNEACFTNPQTCFGLVVWQDQFGPKNSNPLHWHQTPTRRHVDWREFHTWWVEKFLHLFNISHFSSTCCTKNFSLISCSTMAKRIQDQKDEERVVSKSRPAVMGVSSSTGTSSSTVSSPIASKSLGMPIVSGMGIEPSSFDAASTSQVPLKDAYVGGLMEK